MAAVFCSASVAFAPSGSRGFPKVLGLSDARQPACHWVTFALVDPLERARACTRQRGPNFTRGRRLAWAMYFVWRRGSRPRPSSPCLRFLRRFVAMAAVTESIRNVCCCFKVKGCTVPSPPWAVSKQLVRLGKCAHSMQKFEGRRWDLQAFGDDAKVRANRLQPLNLMPACCIGARVCRAVAVYHRGAAA